MAALHPFRRRGTSHHLLRFARGRMAERHARPSCVLPIHANGGSRNARAAAGIPVPLMHRNARIPPRQHRERALASTHVNRITRCMKSTLGRGAIRPRVARPGRERINDAVEGNGAGRR